MIFIIKKSKLINKIHELGVDVFYRVVLHHWVEQRGLHFLVIFQLLGEFSFVSTHFLRRIFLYSVVIITNILLVSWMFEVIFLIIEIKRHIILGYLIQVGLFNGLREGKVLGEPWIASFSIVAWWRILDFGWVFVLFNSCSQAN